ncbi:G patch domain-containing protein 4 isoform X2 [Bacillus rossius redtenbacheri]|uniref:G patch domain-containing protein 4 isoform X2 n=1 Tax=Bacillus rossius redtenbacheri TaxID=93214 RepID=UPI002FDCCE59
MGGKKPAYCRTVAGKGLGKNEDGIAKCLRPKMKFDKLGMGYDAAEQFTNHWWQSAYDRVAGNSTGPRRKKDGVEGGRDDEAADVTTSKRHSSKLKKQLTFGTFQQMSTLVGSVEVADRVPEPDEDEPEAAAPGRALPDEELFQACGGRTVHKAARHGMGLSGKMARVEAQELELLRSLGRKQSRGRERDAVSAREKKKHEKRGNCDQEVDVGAEVGAAGDPESRPEDANGVLKRKRRKKRKSRERDWGDESADVVEGMCDGRQETAEEGVSDEKRNKHKKKHSKEETR